MVIRCRRAVLGEGSELRNGPSPEYPPGVMRILVILVEMGCWRDAAYLLDGGKSAVFMSKG